MEIDLPGVGRVVHTRGVRQFVGPSSGSVLGRRLKLLSRRGLGEGLSRVVLC